jgi:hypothetical protein
MPSIQYKWLNLNEEEPKKGQDLLASGEAEHLGASSLGWRWARQEEPRRPSREQGLGGEWCTPARLHAHWSQGPEGSTAAMQPGQAWRRAPAGWTPERCNPSDGPLCRTARVRVPKWLGGRCWSVGPLWAENEHRYLIFPPNLRVGHGPPL